MAQLISGTTIGGNIAIHAGNIGSYAITSLSGYATQSYVTSQGYVTQSTADGRYLMGTTNPGNVNNFTISIGNNGSYSYVQSHSGQPLELNPIGNTVRIAGNTVWHAGNLTNLNQLSNGPGYLTGITSSQVTSALGYTPYNSTNPSSYITNTNSYYYVNAGSSYGVGFWNSSPETYGITMGTTGTYGSIYNNSEYYLVLSMMNGGGRGVMFRSDNGIYFQVTGGGDLFTRSAIYPGYNNSSVGGQSTYYIYANTDNAGLRTNGSWLVNGNIYWGNQGVWLTDWLNQNVKTNANVRHSQLGLGGASADTQLSVAGTGHISDYLYLGGTAGTLNSWGTRTSGFSGYWRNASRDVTFNNEGYGSSWTFYINGSGAVTINRHIDANTGWGSASGNTLFVGWYGGKVLLGNNSDGAHDFASAISTQSIISTNKHHFYKGAYMRNNVDGAEVLAVDGVNGRLFTVTDSVLDTIYSVNTIAGLPILEILANNTVKIGKYGANSITISNSRIAINSDTVDTNFPFYVSDRSTSSSRYTLANPGMGFNLADNYAQLQLYGPSGAYIDFVTAANDYNGRIIWSGGAFAVTGNMSWGGATLSNAVWNGSAISDSYISSASTWNTAYNKRPTGVSFSGSSTKTLTLTLGDGSTLTAAFNDIDTDTNTDAQTLSLSGNTLSISGGNSVTLSSSGMSQATADGRYLYYRGINAESDFQRFQDAAGEVRFDQINNYNNLSNAPGGYNYGGVLSMRGDNFGFQLWGSHTGDFFFKTQWNDDQYIGWRRVMDTTNYGYAANMNQNVRTDSGPTFSQVYTNGWFRNNSNNTGLYNEANGNHFYSRGAAKWGITGTGGNIHLEFRSNHESTLRGVVYADTSNQIGFLNNGEGWSLRANSSNNVFVHGTDLTINADGAGYSNIIMRDGDEGDRTIHCNSNRIGFLNQSGSWGAWLDDGNNWYAAGALYAPIFYDSENGEYYVDPSGMSKQVRLTNLGTYGSNAANARNHFVQYNSGTATPATGWIAAAFGDASANRVVIGQWGSTAQAIIGSHTGSLNDWAALGYAATEHIFYAPSWTSTEKFKVNSDGVYAPAYRGNANVGGTGTATWHPDGIYVGSTQWLYGTMYKNNSSIYDIGEMTVSNNIGITGGSNAPINITGSAHKYLTINPGNGYEAMVRYIGGSGYSWYVGKRTSGQLVGTQSFHFYSEEAGATVGGIDPSGNMMSTGSMRAPIFYDSGDTGYYLDPNDTSNLWRFTEGTLNRHSLNSRQTNSPWSTRASQGTLYQTGAMGWGQYDLNVIASNWGSGFFDTWSSPANGPGASGHYVGMQAFHYNNSDSARFHGWQMACAQEANNRWFWRSAWDSPRSWVEMIHSGNIGSQSVNYASSAGNADTVDGYHASGLLKLNEWNGNIYIHTDGRIYGTIFYDANNDGYYCNPNGNSRLNEIHADYHRSYGNARIDSHLYMDQNFGSTIVGVYSASRLQGVWSMGDAYKLALDGTNAGNLYGLAWSHPNAGGQAGFLSDHGLIHMMYGTAFATISSNIWCRGDIIAFSDLRVKTNIEVIQNAVEKVMAIRGVTFNRTDFDDKGKRYAGVIAQEVLEVLPEVVTQNEDNGQYSVSYGNISALLIEAIKEQQQQILDLKEEIKKLKGE
jgi:hypothetical protein